MKQPSSIAAIAGKYEFEIMSGTASFIFLFSTNRFTGVFMATSPRRSFARFLPSSKYSLFAAISAWRASSGGQWPRS